MSLADRSAESTQKGFGSVVSLLPGRVIVLQTLPGTPSAKAGLAPGDEILGINGYLISRLDLDQLTQLLSQSRQRPAQLDVRRPGASRVMHLTLIPEDMQSPSVERAFFVGAGIGYIRVGSFDENTGSEIRQAIEKLGGDRLAGLVLDLRNNPGGVVDAALDTASLFLQPGAKIVTVRGRNVPEKTELVPALAKPYDFKLAILINEKTASAAEIVSGAMQDHDRATILGETSFGKGLVQSVYPAHAPAPAWPSPRRSTTPPAGAPSRSRSTCRGRGRAATSSWARPPRIPTSRPNSTPARDAR